MQNLKLTKLKPGLIRLLHHPASNWIGPILQLTGPTWGIDDLLFYSVLFYSKKKSRLRRCKCRSTTTAPNNVMIKKH